MLQHPKVMMIWCQNEAGGKETETLFIGLYVQLDMAATFGSAFQVGGGSSGSRDTDKKCFYITREEEVKARRKKTYLVVVYFKKNSSTTDLQQRDKVAYR